MTGYYLIALGSNQRHPRYGSPERIVQSALRELAPLCASAIITSRPIGPSQRSYANAAAIMISGLTPDAVLADLKALERQFGRRSGGQKWGRRVLDLDIILWSGGLWTSPGLGIPHHHFRSRAFVLRPALQVAGNWRDPVTCLSIRHLAARLEKAKRR